MNPSKQTINIDSLPQVGCHTMAKVKIICAILIVTLCNVS